MMNKIAALLSVMLVLSINTCWADTDKEEDVLKLLTISGSLDQAKDAVLYLTRADLAAVSNEETGIPPQAAKIIEEETLKILMEQFSAGSPLVDELVSIYSEFFSHQEIKEIIAFYESDVGEKMIASMPQIMEKSLMAGQVMGNSLTPLLRENILVRLQQEGIEIEQ